MKLNSDNLMFEKTLNKNFFCTHWLKCFYLAGFSSLLWGRQKQESHHFLSGKMAPLKSEMKCDRMAAMMSISTATIATFPPKTF